MNFESPLIEGKLIRRWNRFLSEVELPNGDVVRAHCPNSGRMTTCNLPGAAVLIRFVDDPKRKLKYTWEMINTGNNWVCINTGRANQVAKEALEQKLIPEFANFTNVRPEFKVGNSRIDFLLENQDDKCFIEVKSVSYIEGDKCCFPDAVTSRGLKHLNELVDLKKQGHRAAMLYLVMSDEPHSFTAADHVDPEYGKTLRIAQKKGVEIYVYTCRTSSTKMTLGRQIECNL